MQIGVVRFGVNRTDGGRGSRYCAIQPGRDCSRHLSRQRFISGAILIEVLRPDMCVSSGINQLDRQVNAAGRPRYRSLDNSIHPEGPRDFGYSQWHADGTEFLNSGSRAPDTQNFCLGVWKKTVLSTYRLNHFALSYDGSTGALTNKVNIREEVKLGPDNNTFAGVFAILLYDPTGTTMVGQITGKITATRVTIDTVLP